MEEYEKFKYLTVPTILKPNDLRVCRVSHDNDLDDDKIVDCGGIDCDDCVLSSENRGIAEIYIQTKGKHTPLTKCFNKESDMNISDNILIVFEKSEDAKKVANRFGKQYGDTDRDLLALKRDKKDLLAIIKDEEEAAEPVIDNR
jgi:hypothetical protein